MSRPLTRSERRTIVVGALLTVPALFFLFAVRPYRAALAEARERLETERSALAREKGAVLAARRNPELLQLADSAGAILGPRLFTGQDDVVASADLASYVGDLARQHHVWLEDASTRTVTSLVPGVRALHIDVRGESDYQGVLEFLDAIERGGKAVRVERLDLSRALPGPGNEHAETLIITATLAGYAPGNPAVTVAPRRIGTGTP